MNLNKMLYNTFNYAGSAVGWWSCVLGGTTGQPWLGPAVVTLYLSIHFFWSKQRREDAIFILTAGFIGIAVESLKKISGLIVYQADVPGWWGVPPVWMMALWLMFVSTLTASLGWLRGRYALSFALGAMFGPLSYLAGEGLGAISLPLPPFTSIVTFAIIWALLLPLMAWLAEKILPVKERALS